MIPRAPFFPAVAAAFSTLSRRGDSTVLDPLRQRLTEPGAIVADLRDLGAATLDDLPDGRLMALAKPLHGRPARLPPLIALPSGCSVQTVNRFLRELPGTECLTAAGIEARGGPVEIPRGTALRLFETTLPRPPLHNAGQVPVLLRVTDGMPSCVPHRSASSEAPVAPVDAVACMRAALCDDGCLLELPSPGAFLDVQTQLLEVIGAMHGRLGAGKAGATSAAKPGRSAAAHPADKLRPRPGEVLAITMSVKMVPRELLSAPAAIVVQDLLRRMDPDAAGAGAGLDRGDLYRIVTLFGQQWDVAYPFRGDARHPRSPRDLATLARLQRWTWPDSAHAKAEPIDRERRARAEASSVLRHAWERQAGFSEALERFAALGVPLPEADLLRRLGVMQAEALGVARRPKQVTFQDPPSSDDDPS